MNCTDTNWNESLAKLSQEDPKLVIEIDHDLVDIKGRKMGHKIIVGRAESGNFGVTIFSLRDGKAFGACPSTMFVPGANIERYIKSKIAQCRRQGKKAHALSMAKGG